MLEFILRFSIERRWLVLLTTLALGAVGVFQFTRLPIDAVPDVTNVQVVINTPARSLSTLEVEQRITYPVEWALAGLPHVQRLRSTSRYGLSQVTVVFEDGTDVYRARQLVAERLLAARETLPPGVEPQLGPIATGLGEIYLYSLRADPSALTAQGKPFDLDELRLLQDWAVRPSLRGVPGLAEVNSIGGYGRLFQVSPHPSRLMGFGFGFEDVLQRLVLSNQSAGGGYLEHGDERWIVRATGLVTGVDDLRDVVVGVHEGVPIRLHDLAEVSIGHELRTGAGTVEGQEAVIGIGMMLAGDNSRIVAQRVDARVHEIEQTLPQGVHVETLYDRTYLVDATLDTVKKNLLEGAFLVIAVLMVMLGNVRAALIAAAAIPLSMLLAITGMVEGKISGNLMSLGAIDFGLIVDGAVIVVEASIRALADEREKRGRDLSRDERHEVIAEASRGVRKATIYGEAIIAIVYLPVLTLTGVEGKMFSPMAITVVLALAGASILSMTFIPAVVALVLTGPISHGENFVVRLAKRAYLPTLRIALARPRLLALGAALFFGVSVVVALGMGSEFAPKLGEGALIVTSTRPPSTSLTKSVEMEKSLEIKLRAAFPDEIAKIFAITGTAEVATDPMGPNVSDTYLVLTPRAQWKKAKTQDELAAAVGKFLEGVPGAGYELSQPIEMRFNDLIAGVRSDVAVKIFGDDMEILARRADRVAAILRSIPGAADVKIEQTSGLPVLTVDVDREAIGRLGLTVADVQSVVEIAVGGKVAGRIFDGARRFDLVVRLPEPIRADVEAIARLPVRLPGSTSMAPIPTPFGPSAGTTFPGAIAGLSGLAGGNFTPETSKLPAFVPLGSVAHVSLKEGPSQVSHESGRRRITVQVNVRGRDLGSYVAEAQRKVADQVKLPAGYSFVWGGQFENLVTARARLMIVVPIALLSIFVLLFASLGEVRNTLLIFTAVPLALTGGVLALFARGLPFSISAGIGFIALSGVAVLNGLVIVTRVEALRREGRSVDDALREGLLERLRPVLMTALVAAIGFLPMALAMGIGSEVQRPLATVVIGGIVSSTLLTLVVLPALYRLAHRKDAMFLRERAGVTSSR